MITLSVVINIIHLLLSAFIIVYAYNLTKSYSKIKKLIPWILIIISYIFDFVGNIGWLNFIFTVGEDNIPYPSWVDFFYLISYVFFAVAIFIIWLNLLKMIKYKGFIKNIIIVLLITIIAGFFSYWLLLNEYFESYVDILYVVIPLLSSVIGIPLLLLMKGGKLESFWLYVVLSGISFTIAETIWTILFMAEINTNFADIFWILGYLLFIFGLKKYYKVVGVNDKN